VEAMNTQRIEDAYFELFKRTPLRPITTEEQHKRAMTTLVELGIKNKAMSRDERDYYQVLSDLVRKYEDSKLPIRKHSTPPEILAFLMKEHGCKQTDLVAMIGHKSNLSAFLSGKRNLSKSAAVRLGQRFHVDPRLFLPQLHI
jgi:HTH-type transcriptional regulator / antitoxin HigA